MDIKQYSNETGRTMAILGSVTATNQNSVNLDNVHMVLGMVTEVGELADVYKKNMAYGKPIDMVNVQEEVGDLMWYISNFCIINNIDIQQVLQTNIDKLRKRFPEKFSSDQAINRDIDAERVILENNSK